MSIRLDEQIAIFCRHRAQDIPCADIKGMAGMKGFAQAVDLTLKAATDIGKDLS